LVKNLFCLYIGGHFNPAVSFAFLIIGKLSALRFILYVIAQNIGAFLASLMVYLSYLNEFKAHPAGMHSIKSSQVFGTLPGNLTTSGIDTFTLFFDQFFATSIFIMIILAVSDENNTTAKLPHTIKALYIGFALMLVGTSFGINCGFAVNPARDFGPRMFTLIFGWGAKVFETGSYFFWIPIVAPMFGAIFAVVIYYVFIGCHLKEN
jgi:MIP family channel proteins